MLFGSRKDLLQAHTDLKDLSRTEATPKQLGDWLRAHRLQLKDLAIEQDMETLVLRGQLERATQFYEQHAFARIARNAGLKSGVLVFMGALAIVMIRDPVMQPLGSWFFILLAMLGAGLFGCGYRTYQHPRSDTIYTQGRFSTARQAKSSDGVCLMLLSGVFLLFAIAGDLILPHLL